MENKFVLLKDLVLPAGTVFSRACNEYGGTKTVECVFGLGKNSTGTAIICVSAIEDADKDLITNLK